MPAFTPMLWFDGAALEAATFYTELFPGSAITDVARMGPDGGIITVAFELGGRPFTALNGGPEHHFTEAVSFVVDCEDQAEVDHYWAALTADGGSEGRCAWCKDRWGVSWQVVPRRLVELLSDPDPARAGRALQAMLSMNRIVVAEIEAAADGVA